MFSTIEKRLEIITKIVQILIFIYNPDRHLSFYRIDTNKCLYRSIAIGKNCIFLIFVKSIFFLFDPVRIFVFNFHNIYIYYRNFLMGR